MVFYQGLPQVMGGLALGLGGAFFLSRVLESMLFGVGIHDAGVFVTVPLFLLAVACVAILIPAVRATHVTPMKVLGTE